MRKIPGQAFITDIKCQKPYIVDEYNHVKETHVKLLQCIDEAGEKIDEMVSNQKAEFIRAYESHIMKILKEIHSLREQLMSLSNDTTIKERVELLLIRRAYYEKKLYVLNNKNMNLVKRLTTVEKSLVYKEEELAWHQTQLQVTKVLSSSDYSASTAYEDGASNTLSLQSLDESLYSLKLNKLSRNQRLTRSLNYLRNPMSFRTKLTRISTSPVLINRSKPDNYEVDSAEAVLPSTSKTDLLVAKAFIAHQTNFDRDLLRDQIIKRTQRDEMVAFVQECASLCRHNNTWRRRLNRAPKDILRDCEEFRLMLPDWKDSQDNRDVGNSGVSEGRSILEGKLNFDHLARELAALPGIYSVIESLIISNSESESLSSEPHEAHSFTGESN